MIFKRRKEEKTVPGLVPIDVMKKKIAAEAIHSKQQLQTLIDTLPDFVLRKAYSILINAGANQESSQIPMNRVYGIDAEKSLYEALLHHQFLVHYQPQMDINTGKIVGVEALIRWNHPEWGLVPPEKWIPIAEETGVILPIDEFVLWTACHQHKKWTEAGLPPIKIAVNFSARQFQQRNIIKLIARVLQETSIDPRFLELEITESRALCQADGVVKTLQTLNEQGIAISIDDFGTGYSSFSYLQLFPIHALKIDRSFIQGICDDHRSQMIIRAMIHLARTLNIKVTAEGVEDLEQLNFLKQCKCDQVQGYLISRPLSGSGMAEYVENLMLKGVNRQ